MGWGLWTIPNSYLGGVACGKGGQEEKYIRGERGDFKYSNLTFPFFPVRDITPKISVELLGRCESEIMAGARLSLGGCWNSQQSKRSMVHIAV